jgi:hypothetical protein
MITIFCESYLDLLDYLHIIYFNYCETGIKIVLIYMSENPISLYHD